MNEFETPRKVNADAIEVIGRQGETLRESREEEPITAGRSFGGVKVIQGGPALLLFLPLLIPIAIVAFLMMTVFALLFGRSAIRVFSTRLFKRS